MRSEEVMLKALKILEKELTNEEFLIYLRTITKRAGDSVKELRERTRDLSLNKVAEMAKKFEE
ncbi:MAG TPA: hypothetical protein ENG66_07770 [Thermococcus sp.]|nr:hypothetical protein [Thermococcus sp.]